jgi:hypothetical protein
MSTEPPKTLGPSLLDVIVDHELPEDISRTLFVCPASRDLSEAAFSRILLNVDEQDATGLVLLQASSIFGYLETTSEDSIEIFKHLSEEDLFADTRIVISSDNVDLKAFESLLFRRVRPKSPSDLEVDTDDLSTSIFHIYARFMELVVLLARKKEVCIRWPVTLCAPLALRYLCRCLTSP